MTHPQLHPLAFPPVGRWLKAQRDVLGLSLSQASDQVQMSEGTLQLLEAERFLDLPEPAFVKGYLRRYANQLRLNPQEVIALFDAWMLLHQSQHGMDTRSASAAVTKAATRSAIAQQGFIAQIGKINAFVGTAMHSQAGHAAAVVVCLGLFSFFLSHGSGLPSSKQHRTTQTVTQTVTLPPQNIVATTAASPVQVSASSPAAKPSANHAAPLPMTQQSSWLIASETTHVHVLDKRGLIVFSGLVRAGSPVMLKGNKPFDIHAAKEGTVSLVNDRHLPGRHQSIAVL